LIATGISSAFFVNPPRTTEKDPWPMIDPNSYFSIGSSLLNFVVIILCVCYFGGKLKDEMREIGFYLQNVKLGKRDEIQDDRLMM